MKLLCSVLAHATGTMFSVAVAFIIPRMLLFLSVKPLKIAAPVTVVEANLEEQRPRLHCGGVSLLLTTSISDTHAFAPCPKPKPFV